MHLLLSLLLAASAATEITPRSGAYADSADIVWTDHAGQSQRMSPTFSAGALAEAPILAPDNAEMVAETAHRLRSWAAARGIEAKIEVDGTVIKLRAPTSELPVLKARRDALLAEVRAEHHLVKTSAGLSYDLGRLTTHHVEAVRSIASGVGPMLRTRELATRALSMVQGVPYETVRGQFRTPLAIVRDDRGDCDEKSVFFAAMVRAVDPSIPLAIVTMEGHAFVAIGLPPLPGETTITIEDQTWVVAEAAGPRLSILGYVSAKSKTAIESGAIRVWRVPTGR